jgi:anaerobic magnesium-protoporphyrin IX monomethyl ester cyclase
MKIQLINLDLPYRLRHSNPSLSLLYIAAGLQIDGHAVEYIEAFSGKPASYMTQFVKSQPDCVGFTSYAANWKYVAAAIGEMRASRPKTVFIAGGIHTSFNAVDILSSDPAPDVVFSGESEESIREWAKVYDERLSWDKVQGLYIKQGNRYIFTGERMPPADLDKLPFPAWELIDPRGYCPAHSEYFRRPHAQMIFSRSLSCDSGRYTAISGIRHRSAEHILEEINWLIRYHGVKDLIFHGDSILTPSERTKKLCEEIIRRKIDLTWTAYARVSEIEPEILKLMRRAGCRQLKFKLTSGVQKNLETLNAGFTIEQVRVSVKATNTAGILTSGIFIFGIPGETVGEANQTIEFARGLNLYHSSITFFTPFPGSDLYEQLMKSHNGTIIADGAYDTETPSYVPNDMTRESLIEFQKLAQRRFYLSPRGILNRIKVNIVR